MHLDCELVNASSVKRRRGSCNSLAMRMEIDNSRTISVSNIKHSDRFCTDSACPLNKSHMNYHPNSRGLGTGKTVNGKNKKRRTDISTDSGIGVVANQLPFDGSCGLTMSNSHVFHNQIAAAHGWNTGTTNSSQPITIIFDSAQNKLVTEKSKGKQRAAPPPENIAPKSSQRATKRRKVDASPQPDEIKEAPQNVSMAEVRWAQATNRLTDKVEPEDAESSRNGSMIVRAKRRLVLMTQLMQQLIPPIEQKILTEPAVTVYKTLIYMVAKRAISTTNSWNSEFPESGGQDVQKVLENHLQKSERLEHEFTRLQESGISSLDVRLAYQDLERLSITNHLSKFQSSQTSGKPTMLTKTNITSPMLEDLCDEVVCHKL